MGAPTTYTDELGERIVAARRAGCSRQAAANLVGISESTVREWERIRPEFLRAVRVACGEYLLEAAQAIQTLVRAGDLNAARLAVKSHDREQWSEAERLRVELGEDDLVTRVRLAGLHAQLADGILEPEERERAERMIAEIEAGA